MQARLRQSQKVSTLPAQAGISTWEYCSLRSLCPLQGVFLSYAFSKRSLFVQIELSLKTWFALESRRASSHLGHFENEV
jgi:hypothetical protein